MKANTLIIKKAVTPKQKTLTLAISVVCAVVLPCIVHLIGMLGGTGKALGEILLPMHLPIIVCGFTGGPIVGVICGILSPIISYSLTAMPAATVLPYMCIELATYGLVGGYLSKTKLPSLAGLAITLAAGRLVRIFSMYLSVALFSVGGVSVEKYLGSLPASLVGIAIQLIFVILFMRTQKDNK